MIIKFKFFLIDKSCLLKAKKINFLHFLNVWVTIFFCLLTNLKFACPGLVSLVSSFCAPRLFKGVLYLLARLDACSFPLYRQEKAGDLFFIYKGNVFLLEPKVPGKRAARLGFKIVIFGM